MGMNKNKATPMLNRLQTIVNTCTEHPSHHGLLACMRRRTDHCFQTSCTCPARTQHLHKYKQQVFMECRWQSFLSHHHLAIAVGESILEVSSLLLAKLLDVCCTSSVFVALPSEAIAEAVGLVAVGCLGAPNAA